MVGYSAFNCIATLCLPCACQVLFAMTFQNNAINWQQQTQLSTKFMNPEPPQIKLNSIHLFINTRIFFAERNTVDLYLLSIR